MEPWYWLNENSRAFLSRGYLAEGQTAEQRIRVIADTAEKYLKRDGFSDKFYEYMSKGWISLSSPVWSNFGITKGLPISCFGSYAADNMASILYTNAEVGMMSKFGGGCSGYFGERAGSWSRYFWGNGHSSGAVHFMQLFETLVDVVVRVLYDEDTFHHTCQLNIQISWSFWISVLKVTQSKSSHME
jgi:ribonucleoside-diphosphate reductase alpha chain